MKSKKTADRKATKKWGIARLFPVILIVCGLIGLGASIAISYEKEQILKDPQANLACNLNPVYSCANVITSDQAAVFGFSNELIGIAIFGALITLGVVLFAGAEMKTWLWRLFMSGMIGYMLVVLWFFYNSVYIIGSLCVFCTMVWFAGWSLTAAGFAWTYDKGYLPVPARLSTIARAARQNIIYVWIGIILLIATLIIRHFWYYYGQYFN